MAYSKIDICNMGLALLGAAPIRSFDESNKRARMCDIIYNMKRDFFLTKFDWPFARKFVKLNQVITAGIDPSGVFVFELPNDCKSPRDIHPPGSKDWWRVQGTRLLAKKSEVCLYYTAKEVNVAVFSDTYINVLALAIAVAMSPSITQDKNVTAGLAEQLRIMELDVTESDANIGNDYRAYDETPDNDSFVNPDIVYEVENPYAEPSA